MLAEAHCGASSRSLPDSVMNVALFVQHLFNGLLDGIYYLLIALGLSLIFSLGGIVNLAHGAFYAVGAYLSLEVGQRLGFGAGVVISPVLVGLLGIAFERFLLRRFYSADPILSLLVTFGLAMVAEQAIRMKACGIINIKFCFTFWFTIIAYFKFN